jgi:hypothetical protein
MGRDFELPPLRECGRTLRVDRYEASNRLAPCSRNLAPGAARRGRSRCSPMTASESLPCKGYERRLHGAENDEGLTF